MKIEKISDNQIRCTLTRDDLATRNLKLSELAYGTEKAKSLFREMMQHANHEFGFEAEDIPLMIEAIPLNADCLVLIITKVEDPEELDTRFSKFSPLIHEPDEEDSDDFTDEFEADSPEEIRDLFRRLSEADGSTAPTEPTKEPVSPELKNAFRIGTMNQVLTACSIMAGRYMGESALYRDKSSGNYVLLLDGHLAYGRPERVKEYYSFCNILSEYGALLPQASRDARLSACEAILPANAVKVLGNQ